MVLFICDGIPMPATLSSGEDTEEELSQRRSRVLAMCKRMKEHRRRVTCRERRHGRSCGVVPDELPAEAFARPVQDEPEPEQDHEDEPRSSRSSSHEVLYDLDYDRNESSNLSSSVRSALRAASPVSPVSKRVSFKMVPVQVELLKEGDK